MGDTVAIDDTLITLETDKATMDVPSTAAGKVTAVNIKVGDKVSQGTVIITVEGGAAAPATAPAQAAAPAPVATPAPVAAKESTPPVAASTTILQSTAAIDESGFAKAHAGPSSRKFARELGVDLAKVKVHGSKRPCDQRRHQIVCERLDAIWQRTSCNRRRFIGRWLGLVAMAKSGFCPNLVKSKYSL